MRLARLGALEEKLLLPKEPFRRLLLVLLDLRVLRIFCIFDKIGRKVWGARPEKHEETVGNELCCPPDARGL